MHQERAIDKYTRLVAAAAKVVHERGFRKTVLADIAAEAEVPQGSLYYYFKTRDDVVAAILGERMSSLNELVGKWEMIPDPKKRLNALIQVWVEDREIDSRYGCPIGSLCYELAKDRGELSLMAAEPLSFLVDWCEVQFKELGKTARQASDLAKHLICALQGASLLANAFGDPQVIMREANQLKRWLRDL